jgi:signal transduction histidine kinase
MSNAFDADTQSAGSVTLPPAEWRDVNRWWTIACSVSNVAHDLKNALQVISGNVEMLQLRADLDTVTARRLHAIAAQAARAADAMDPLVGYARESSAGTSNADFRTLAPVALSFRSVSLGRRGVMTSVVCAGDVALVGAIDRPAALQLLLNLLLRAEAHVSGRSAASIALMVERRDDAVVVVVAGTAEGDRSETVKDSIVASEVSDNVIADIADAYHATLRIETDSSGFRATLSVPAEG